MDISLCLFKDRLPFLEEASVKFNINEQTDAVALISIDGSSDNVLRFGHAMFRCGASPYQHTCNEPQPALQHA